jgi:hypothetical protein
MVPPPLATAALDKPLEFGDFGLAVLNLVILLVRTAVSFDRQRRHNWKLKGRWL